MTLDAVRHAILAEAEKEAADLRAQAAGDAADAVARARQEADDLLAGARAAGEAEARAAAAADLARARRGARQAVLAAQRAVYEEVREAVRRQAAELRTRPEYPELLAALTAAAHRVLGDGATVTEDAEVGGVTATRGQRSVDYRLPAVADRCLQEVGSEVEVLWR